MIRQTPDKIWRTYLKKKKVRKKQLIQKHGRTNVVVKETILLLDCNNSCQSVYLSICLFVYLSVCKNIICTICLLRLFVLPPANLWHFLVGRHGQDRYRLLHVHPYFVSLAENVDMPPSKPCLPAVWPNCFVVSPYLTRMAKSFMPFFLIFPQRLSWEREWFLKSPFPASHVQGPYNAFDRRT